MNTAIDIQTIDLFNFTRKFIRFWNALMFNNLLIGIRIVCSNINQENMMFIGNLLITMSLFSTIIAATELPYSFIALGDWGGLDKMRQ